MGSDLQTLLSRFSDLRVAVVGDLMLDVYLWGQVSRISPEAPVPVVNMTRRTSCLGGAGNVMSNLSCLGGKVMAFGVVGNDPCGAEIRRLLEEQGIDASGILADVQRRSTEKRRVVAGGQQLLREDFEDLFPLSEELRRKMADQVISLVKSGKVDAVIFEDYAKGVLDRSMLEEIISSARERGVITALDPKPGGVPPAAGLTVIKPNRGEAFALSGVPDKSPELPPVQDTFLQQAAQKLFSQWNSDQLLISLASQGMALFRKGEPAPTVIPTRAREVFDVSGAGDTVTATYTMALAAGADPERAAEIANLAAGVVVGKMGTAPIHTEELKQAVEEFDEEKHE